MLTLSELMEAMPHLKQVGRGMSGYLWKWGNEKKWWTLIGKALEMRGFIDRFIKVAECVYHAQHALKSITDTEKELEKDRKGF
jgi:hypothetical protein